MEKQVEGGCAFENDANKNTYSFSSSVQASVLLWGHISPQSLDNSDAPGVVLGASRKSTHPRILAKLSDIKKALKLFIIKIMTCFDPLKNLFVIYRKVLKELDYVHYNSCSIKKFYNRFSENSFHGFELNIVKYRNFKRMLN